MPFQCFKKISLYLAFDSLYSYIHLRPAVLGFCINVVKIGYTVVASRNWKHLICKYLIRIHFHAFIIIATLFKVVVRANAFKSISANAIVLYVRSYHPGIAIVSGPSAYLFVGKIITTYSLKILNSDLNRGNAFKNKDFQYSLKLISSSSKKLTNTSWYVNNIKLSFLVLLHNYSWWKKMKHLTTFRTKLT